MMKNVTQIQDEGNHIERCGIVATCPKGSRLLASKKIPAATGERVATATRETVSELQLMQWVVGLVFDTTLSNTGIENGSAVLFERELERFLFYIGCRHHIYEVYLKTCFDAIFGKSGTIHTFFKKLK